MAVYHPGVAVAHRIGLQQGGVGAGSVGLGHGESRAQLAGQQRFHPALLLLLVAADGQQFGVARVGGVVAEDGRRDRRPAQYLVHQPQLHLTKALAPQLRVEVAGPQPPVLDLLLQRRGQRFPLLVGHLQLDGFQRQDVLVEERPGPVQLLLELGLGLEIPGHLGPLSVGDWVGPVGPRRPASTGQRRCRALSGGCRRR